MTLRYKPAGVNLASVAVNSSTLSEISLHVHQHIKTGQSHFSVAWARLM